jgi:hypothetical protein
MTVKRGALSMFTLIKQQALPPVAEAETSNTEQPE